VKHNMFLANVMPLTRLLARATHKSSRL